MKAARALIGRAFLRPPPPFSLRLSSLSLHLDSRGELHTHGHDVQTFVSSVQWSPLVSHCPAAPGHLRRARGHRSHPTLEHSPSRKNHWKKQANKYCSNTGKPRGASRNTRKPVSASVYGPLTGSSIPSAQPCSGTDRTPKQ